MPVIPVIHAQIGDRLGSDVITALGSVLMEEGRLLSERDLEVLQAFLVPSVDIRRAGTEDASVEPADDPASLPVNVPVSSLEREFLKMENLLKKTYAAISPGMKLPDLELRTALKALLAYIEDYSILSFKPPGIAAKEDVMVRNSVLCAMTSYLLAKWTKFPEKDWVQVAMAGLLHDIGNVKVDPAILNKTGRLTAAELQEIRQHTVYGFRMLEGGTALTQGIWLTALQHHERIDGSGYPLKVKGDKIHPYAKVVAIADMYHAMTSNRNYKKAESPYLVLEELQAEAFGKLDPMFVQTFIERTTQFHNGVVVRLSDGRIGEIVFSDRNHPTRPMVAVRGTIVNLVQDSKLFIHEVFPIK